MPHTDYAYCTFNFRALKTAASHKQICLKQAFPNCSWTNLFMPSLQTFMVTELYAFCLQFRMMGSSKSLPVADDFFKKNLWNEIYRKIITCSCSVTKFCLTLFNTMDGSTPGFPVLHHLLEFAQTCVPWVGDATQPSHPLLSPLLLLSIFPSIRVFSNELALSIRWAKYWSFSFSISLSNYIQGWFPLGWTGLISFPRDSLAKGVRRVVSNTTIQKHQFFCAQPSL